MGQFARDMGFVGEELEGIGLTFGVGLGDNDVDERYDLSRRKSRSCSRIVRLDIYSSVKDQWS